MPQPSKLLAEWALTAPWAPSLEGWWTDLRVAGRALRRNPPFLVTGADAGARRWRQRGHLYRRERGVVAARAVSSRIAPGAPLGDPASHRRLARRAASAVTAHHRGRNSHAPSGAAHAHASLFTTGPSLMTLTGAGQATRMQGMGVSPGYFETLGVSAHLGRTSGPAEEAPGADAVLILSYGI